MESCCTWVGSGLTRKHSSRLERLAQDKRSSLLWKDVTYGRKKCYDISPGLLIYSYFKEEKYISDDSTKIVKYHIDNTKPTPDIAF